MIELIETHEPKRKPFKWYCHKIPCEVSYWLSIKTGGILASFFLRMYYHNLNKLCETGFNLYGSEL